MKTPIRHLAVALAAFFLTLESHAAFNIYSIGFKVAADEPTNSFLSSLAAADVAGLPSVAQANWNNLTLKANNPASPVAIVANSNGTPIATSVTLAWNANGTWANYGRGEYNGTNFLISSPPNVKLMDGYLDTGNATTTTLTLSNLPPELTGLGYDVYVYALASAAGRGGSYRLVDPVSGAVIQPYLLYVSDTKPTDYVQDPGTAQVDATGSVISGNYLVFRGVTNANLQVQATTTVNPYSGTPRAPLEGVQLVARQSAGQPPPASALILTTNGPGGQLGISWTPGAGSDGSLVLIRQGRVVTAEPVDGVTYTPNTTLGSGQNLGNDNIGAGNFAVYAGSATNVTVTGLTSGFFPLTYYVSVFAYNGSGASINYTLSPASGSATVPASLTNAFAIQADQPGIQISSNLFGIFFEEINFGGEGGLYAEMVRNRAFYSPTSPLYWTLVTQGTAAGSMSVDTTQPLNTNLVNSLKLIMSSGTGSVGAGNSGFWGMALAQGELYDLSFYATAGASGFNGPLSARLESADGNTLYAQTSFTGLNSGWQRFAATLTSSGTTTNARLVVSIDQAGTVWLDVVSLFPRATFHNHTNGLRADIGNMLAALKPSFFRFPGGNYIESNTITNAVRWKKSIGDIAQRPGHMNDSWGYWSTDGFGAYEFFQFCEDLGMQPLYGINAGLMLGYNGGANNTVPLASMAPWVQDAVDLVSYANDDTNTTWGAVRAAAGHPAPFNLNYLEIGNENGGSLYDQRYTLFYDALTASYPNVTLISPVWGSPSSPTSRPVEMRDEHYYTDPSTMASYATKYDSYSRSGPKVFVGEYAVTSGGGNGNLAGALGEAAFMTGMERNSDVVTMASYAPLFANANSVQWRPDLIWYDNSRVYGTPSYYVQQMFGVNRGDYVVPFVSTIPPTNHGAIGVATWNTSSAYSNLVVAAGANVLYQSDFSTVAGTNGFQFIGSNWSVTNGLLQQNAANLADQRATYGSTGWSNYIYTVRAMKLSGSEGFLIMFNVLDSNNYMWWNIGGWNNTQTGIEWARGGSKTTLASASGSVNSNQWYDIRIELSTRIRCYLNGTLIHDIPSPGVAVPLTLSSSLVPSKGQVILKAVNLASLPLTTQVGVNAARGLAPTATATVLTGTNLLGENSLGQPTNIYPVTNIITGVSTNFLYTFAPNSLTVLRFQEVPESPVGITLDAATNQLSLAALSNGIPIRLSSFITNNVTVNYTVEAPGAGVLASGIAQFAPGDLAKSIVLSIPNLQSYSLVRVTLSNPVNGQLSGLTQTYYVNLPDVGGRPVLGLGQFGNQTLLYWSNPGDTLWQGDTVFGPWIGLTNVPSPVSLTLTNPQQFYRLRR